MEDRTPEITKKMNEMIQKKTPYERYQMGWSMYLTYRYQVIRELLEKNPNISEVDLKKELFLKFYRDDFIPEQQEKILKHLETVTNSQK